MSYLNKRIYLKRYAILSFNLFSLHSYFFIIKKIYSLKNANTPLFYEEVYFIIINKKLK
jgi:hypothetical protein